MKNYIENTLNYHNKQYKKLKFKFQRVHANEDVIRFIAKNKKFIKKNGKILDLGCGSGRNLKFFENSGLRSDGLDFSSEGLKLAKKLIKKKSTNLILDALPNMVKIKKDNYVAVIDCFTSFALTKEDFKIYLTRVHEVLIKKGLFHCQIFSSRSDLFINYKPAKKISKYSLKRIKRKNAPFSQDPYLWSFPSKFFLYNILKSKKFQKINIETHSRTYRNSKEYLEYFVISCQK